MSPAAAAVRVVRSKVSCLNGRIVSGRRYKVSSDGSKLEVVARGHTEVEVEGIAGN